MTEFDFGNLQVPGKRSNETDPRAILRSLPVRTGAINDLWDGQAQALSQWNDRRTRSDNLILLNTGAGKTIVGLLIAESLRREMRGNVLYLCANNDLVGQVAKEADRLGLEHTTRVGGRFNNDLFERGKAICITNYQALLNAQTTFRGEKGANALILDDAHVAEGIIRDQFTLRLSKSEQPDLYRSLVQALVEDEPDSSWKANRVLKEDRDLAPLTSQGASTNAFEEALRYLGECLGFEASRPDNEAGKGPDVLWLSRLEKLALGLEAKSDKTADAYNKSDIGQAHQHLVWLGEAHDDRQTLGLLLVGQPKGVTEGASPSSQMYAVDLQALKALVAAYRDLRSSARADLGASRLAQVAKLGIGDEWTLAAVMDRLAPTALA
jgi:hypothetical protein